MTLFDIIALSLLAVSGIAGFVRGAAREMAAVLALAVGAAASLFGLRFTAPLMRPVIKPDWMAEPAALLAGFLVVYLIVRIALGGLAQKIHTADGVGMVDRVGGLGFGLFRSLLALGAFNLAFTTMTPPERMPRWIADATLYPLTMASSEVLKAFAPKGLDMAGRLKPAIADAVRDGRQPTQFGYDSRDRSGVDDLVENSR